MNIQSLSKACRTCLMENNLTPIFGDSIHSSIPNMLNYLAGIQVYEESKLPNMICDICLPRLNLAYDFKFQCRLSEEKLQLLIEKATIVNNSHEVSNDDTVIKEENRDDDKQLSDYEGYEVDASQISGIESNCSLNNISIPNTFKTRRKRKQMKKNIHNQFSSSNVDSKLQKSNKNNILYKCINCKKRFTNQKAHLRHMKIIHAIKQPLKCDQCEKCYSTPESLKDHFMVIHEGKRLTCDICQQEFKYASSYLTHKKYHKGDKRHSCEICKETFVKKLELMMHLKNIHWTPGDNLDADKIVNNQIIKKFLYNCLECTAIFTTAAVLRRHTLVVHNNVRSFLCSECGHACPSAAALRSHFLRHSGEKNLACPHCDMKFTWRAALKSHISSHTGVKPYPCADCGQGFSSAGTRREHTLRHHTEAPLACRHCPLRFTRAPQLARHARVHTGDQLYQCDQCSARYSHKSSLTIHYKSMHKAVMPYKCKLCPETFSNCKKLYKHRVDHHPMEKRAKNKKCTKVNQ